MVNSNTTCRKHADLNLEINGTWLAVVICVWCLETVATLTFKVLIFRLIYKKGPLIDSPINILILFDELGWFLQLIFIPQMFYILHVKNTEELHGQKGCLFLHIYVLLVCSVFNLPAPVWGLSYCMFEVHLHKGTLDAAYLWEMDCYTPDFGINTIPDVLVDIFVYI